jgi:hypothetical protein
MNRKNQGACQITPFQASAKAGKPDQPYWVLQEVNGEAGAQDSIGDHLEGRLMVLVAIMPVRDVNFPRPECSQQRRNPIHRLSAVRAKQSVETSIRIRQELQILRRNAERCSGSGDFSITQLCNPLTGGISGIIAKAAGAVGQNDNFDRNSPLALQGDQAATAERLVILMRGKDNG